MSLTIDKEELGTKGYLLFVRGEIDQHSYDMLDQLLEDLIDDGALMIVLDIREMTYISSSGIGVFVSAMSRIEGEGGTFMLTRPNQAVKDVLDTMGFTELFTFIDDPRQSIVAATANTSQ